MENFKDLENQVWQVVRSEAREISESEPVLKELVNDVILSRPNLYAAVSARLARKIGAHALPENDVFNIFCELISKDESAQRAIVRDIAAIKDRDPACLSYLDPLLYYKGFHAICVYRVSHILWMQNRRHLALYFQSLSSEILGVDIHPAAKFGGGIFLDHATSFVAGETSTVDDDVSILHEVTLGGTGSETGDRHPKVRSGVLIGAGAKLIGNIIIGKGAKIGAGSVVLNDVAEHTTVAGVPARPIGISKDTKPSVNMNQNLE